MDEFPQMVKQVPVRYPEAARQRGEEGIVYVRAYVGKDGLATKVEVDPGHRASRDLEQAALEAVPQWMSLAGDLRTNRA